MPKQFSSYTTRRLFDKNLIFKKNINAKHSLWYIYVYLIFSFHTMINYREVCL